MSVSDDHEKTIRVLENPNAYSPAEIGDAQEHLMTCGKCGARASNIGQAWARAQEQELKRQNREEEQKKRREKEEKKGKGKK